MASRTCKRPCKVQGRVSEPTDSIPSRFPSTFGGSDKLAGTQTLLSEPCNILAVPQGPPNVPTTTLASFEVLPRVYSNKEV